MDVQQKKALFTPCHRSSSRCVTCVLQLFTVRDGHSGCFATHERRVDEIVAKLRPAELEQVIKPVGQRSETNASAGARREHLHQRSGMRSACRADQAPRRLSL